MYRDPQYMSCVTQGGEDNNTGQHASQEVHHRDDVSIHVNSGVKLVVASEHDDPAPGDAEREEHLDKMLQIKKCTA